MYRSANWTGFEQTFELADNGLQAQSERVWRVEESVLEPGMPLP